MSRILERRIIHRPLSVRDAAADGKPRILSGYAATFNNESQDLGGYVEVLKKGCFAESIKAGDQRAFYNHCYDDLLGRTKSGTLRLSEDETGLAFEIDVPDTQLGHDLYELVKRGDIDGVSFGFYALKDEWSADGKTNTILEAELIEISPVVFPAYLQPKVEARANPSAGQIAPDRLANRPAVKFPSLERAKRIITLDDEA